MNTHPKFSRAAAFLFIIGTGLAMAQTNQPVAGGTNIGCSPLTNLATIASTAPTNPPAAQPDKNPLPRLVDLGAGKCIPCKMMAPILEELKEEYAGRMNVEFVDVWENPDAAKQYGIEVIPTQIFYDAKGKELFRHIGFFAKADILAKWKELGVDLTGPKNGPQPD